MFTKKSVGLDIADHTIEVVQLQQSLFSSKPVITGLGRITLESGIIEHGRIISKKRLQESLNEAFESAKPNSITSHSVVLGIPERQVYTSLISLKCDRKNLPEQVADAATNTIPLEKDELVLAYKVLSENSETCEILLYGTSKEILQEWSDFCSESDISLVAFDHELLAITRGLFGETISQPSCIVDLGAERTKIAIYSQKGLQYVYALDVAGDVFTLELSKLLSVSESEAEKIKREEGMVMVKVLPMFEKILTPILAEVRTALDFYKEKNQESIKKLILVGGSSRLVGLKEYISEKLKLDVVHGSPFILPETGLSEDLSRLHYVEALGLALRGLDTKKWERIHPSLKLSLTFRH